MAVPTTTGQIATRVTALALELEELVIGCRNLTDNSAAGKAAAELGHALAVSRKAWSSGVNPSIATLKARL